MDNMDVYNTFLEFESYLLRYMQVTEFLSPIIVYYIYCLFIVLSFNLRLLFVVDQIICKHIELVYLV